MCVSKGNLSKIYRLYQIITKEIKLRLFQFKIIHNTVFTKDRLFKASIVQDDNFFCKENLEILQHLLFHCPFTVAFWNVFGFLNGDFETPRLN